MNRRKFLRRSSFLLGTGFFSGCLESENGETPEPVDLSGEKFDDQGGMAIGDHGGPNGQIFYTNNSPEGRENPAWFHTLVFGLFPYHFDRVGRGWEAKAIYATDYSSIEWSPSEKDSPRLPSPTAPETFADATELAYVAESSAVGGMGPSLPPFSNKSEAENFADEYGGTVVEFENITRGFIERLRTNSQMDGKGMGGGN